MNQPLNAFGAYDHEAHQHQTDITLPGRVMQINVIAPPYLLPVYVPIDDPHAKTA